MRVFYFVPILLFTNCISDVHLALPTSPGSTGDEAPAPAKVVQPRSPVAESDVPDEDAAPPTPIEKTIQDSQVSIIVPYDYVVKVRVEKKTNDPPLSFVEPENRFTGTVTYEPYEKGVLDYSVAFAQNMNQYAEKLVNTNFSYIDGVSGIAMMTTDKEKWFMNYFFVKHEYAYTLRCTAEYGDQVSYMLDECQKLIAGFRAKGNDDFPQ